MRMIDGEKLYNIEKLLDTDIIQNSKEAAYLMSQVLYDIEAMPTIDPETLPIVQKLRAKIFMLETNIEPLKKQLAKVTAERDYAIKAFENKVKYNEFPCIHCESNGVVCSGVTENYCSSFKFRGLQEVQDNE